MEILALILATIALVMVVVHMQWHTKDGLCNEVKVKQETPLGNFVTAFNAHMDATGERDRDNTFLFAAKLYEELTLEEKRQLSFEIRTYMLVHPTIIGTLRGINDVVFTPDFEIDEE